MVLRKDTIITLTGKQKLSVPIFTYDEANEYLGKGWNYINFYDLLKLKQAYIALLTHDKQEGKKDFYAQFKKLTGEIADNRSMDEYLNALKCFNIIPPNNSSPFVIINKLNFDTTLPLELTDSDKIEISKYYFSYIRFKYFHNWFLENILDKSKIFNVSAEDLVEKSVPVFCFSDKIYFDNEDSTKKSKKTRKLIDSFFYSSVPEYYQFDSQIETESKEEKALMRFWDVYIEWGRKLNFMEKINLSQALDIKACTTENKNLYLNYFINNSAEIDLKNFIQDFYPANVKSISLPELTINLALHYRCSITQIHREIIQQSNNSNHQYSLQKTSAIFITGKEFIYPKIGNTFISHIYIR